MNKGVIKSIAIILLLSIAIFSMVMYYRAQNSLAKAQEEIVALTQEKQNLLQELGKEKELNGQLASKNTGLKNYLKVCKNKIARLFQDKSRLQGNLEDADARFSILKAENDQLRVKLSSIIELRKAIRELKAKKRRSRALADGGNLGFVIRNGRSTIPEKVKIEVVPAQTKEQ